MTNFISCPKLFWAPFGVFSSLILQFVGQPKTNSFQLGQVWGSQATKSPLNPLKNQIKLSLKKLVKNPTFFYVLFHFLPLITNSLCCPSRSIKVQEWFPLLSWSPNWRSITQVNPLKTQDSKSLFVFSFFRLSIHLYKDQKPKKKVV